MLVIGLQGFQESWQFIRAKIAIYFRYFLFQFGPVTLAQATCNIYFINPTVLFGIHISQNGINAFLACIINKAAGINNYNRGIFFFRFMLYLVLISFQLSHQYLGINQVFGTSEGNYVYLILF